MTNVVGFFNELHGTYGDIVRFDVPGRTHIAVFEADLVRQVLEAQADALPPLNPVSSFEVVQAEVLARKPPGEDHARLQELVASAYTPERIAFQDQVAAEEGERLADSLNPGAVDLRASAEEFAYRTLARIVIGGGEELGREVVSPSLLAIKFNFILFAMPGYRFVKRLPLPHDLKARKAIRPLDEVTYREIDRARRSDAVPVSMVGHLVRAASRFDWRFDDDRHIRDEAYAILLGAVDGIVHTLSLAPYYLGRHPEVQALLEEEVDRTTDLSRLRNTRAVVMELLRVQPPATILVPRVAVRDCTIGGYLIPKGAFVDVGIHTIHRRPDYWQEPDSFRPERWLDGTRPGCHFMPFSLPPKQCQGADLAPKLMTAALAAVARRWRLEYGGAEFPPPVGLRPGSFSGGVTASVTARPANGRATPPEPHFGQPEDQPE